MTSSTSGWGNFAKSLIVSHLLFVGFNRESFSDLLAASGEKVKRMCGECRTGSKSFHHPPTHISGSASLLVSSLWAAFRANLSFLTDFFSPNHASTPVKISGVETCCKIMCRAMAITVFTDIARFHGHYRVISEELTEAFFHYEKNIALENTRS